MPEDCPSLPQCCGTLFTYEFPSLPKIYFNTELVYNCPPGYEGNEVTVPAGQFSSLISQEDADAKALAYAISQADCQPSAGMTIVFQDAVYSETNISPASYLTIALDGGSAVTLVPGTSYFFSSNLTISGGFPDGITMSGSPAQIQQSGIATVTGNVTLKSSSSVGATLTGFDQPSFINVEFDASGTGTNQYKANGSSSTSPLVVSAIGSTDANYVDGDQAQINTFMSSTFFGSVDVTFEMIINIEPT